MREILKVEQIEDTIQITVKVTSTSADLYEFKVGWDGLPEIRLLDRNIKLGPPDA